MLRDLQYDEELDYILVGPGEVDTRNRRISIQSPVGSALKDRGVGDTVEVDIPSGKAHYRIERIEQAWTVFSQGDPLGVSRRATLAQPRGKRVRRVSSAVTAWSGVWRVYSHEVEVRTAGQR